LGIKVPPGFIITSETCKDFFEGNQAMSAHLNDALKSSITKLEKTTGKSFTLTDKSPNNIRPLLLSVRSGAAVDMPRCQTLNLHDIDLFRMMDSILNIGVNDAVIQRLLEQTADPRFAYDVQKKFLQMFGTVVRQVPNEEFLKIVNEEKAHDGVVKDSELCAKSLQNIIHEFKKLVDVPDDPLEQLKVAIESIFGSWMSSRSVVFETIIN
jgi:pyruvate, orthophosphate dikinase